MKLHFFFTVIYEGFFGDFVSDIEFQRILAFTSNMDAHHFQIVFHQFYVINTFIFPILLVSNNQNNNHKYIYFDNDTQYFDNINTTEQLNEYNSK